MNLSRETSKLNKSKGIQKLSQYELILLHLHTVFDFYPKANIVRCWHLSHEISAPSKEVISCQIMEHESVNRKGKKNVF